MAEGDEKCSSSLSLMRSLVLATIVPLKRSLRTKGDESSKGLRNTSILIGIMQKIDKVKEKVNRVGKARPKTSEIKALICNMKAAIESSIPKMALEAKINKINMLILI